MLGGRAAAAWALSAGPDTEGEGSRTLRVARASQKHLTRLTQTTTYLLPITKHQQRLHPPTEATLHSVCHTLSAELLRLEDAVGADVLWLEAGMWWFV